MQRGVRHLSMGSHGSHTSQRNIKEKHVLLDVPLPRRIASRPVPWIAETMELGGALPSTKTSWSFRLASTFRTPAHC